MTGYHLGIPVGAIGFTWNKGENAEPNPSTWSETTAADKESVAVHLFGGMAAEILKLKDFDYNARIADIQAFNQLGCTLPGEHYNRLILFPATCKIHAAPAVRRLQRECADFL